MHKSGYQNAAHDIFNKALVSDCREIIAIFYEFAALVDRCSVIVTDNGYV